MDKLSTLLQNLKDIHSTYCNADNQAMQEGKWSYDNWQIKKQYWAIAEQVIDEIQLQINQGRSIEVTMNNGESFAVATLGITVNSQGHPMVSYSSVPNATHVYGGFRLDRVESLEVIKP